MATKAKRKEDLIRVKQYITDMEGHKLGAVIDMEELKRLEVLIEIIPAPEAWLYQNREALESVRRGLKDAASGKVSKLDLNEL